MRHVPKFRGENFCGWLSNLKICESFLPRKFPAIRYRLFCILQLCLCFAVPHGSRKLSINQSMNTWAMYCYIVHTYTYIGTAIFSYEKLVWGSLWLAPIVFNSHSGPDWPGLQLNDPVTSSLKQVFHHFQQFWCT